MNEETNKQLDDKKKTAVLRYLAVLFAAAFLIVLLSMLSQFRNSMDTISQLNQSSTNALAKAEQLQDTNRQLEERVRQLEQQLADTNALLMELEAAEGKEKEAYELLLTAIKLVTPGSQEGNVAASKALDNLKNYESYLGEEGLKIYKSLLQEGE